MEYIRGCTLKALMRAHRARGLPIAALRFWFAEVMLINQLNECYYFLCVLFTDSGCTFVVNTANY
jgi:hypothetical protein